MIVMRYVLQWGKIKLYIHTHIHLLLRMAAKHPAYNTYIHTSKNTQMKRIKRERLKRVFKKLKSYKPQVT